MIRSTIRVMACVAAMALCLPTAPFANAAITAIQPTNTIKPPVHTMQSAMLNPHLHLTAAANPAAKATPAKAAATAKVSKPAATKVVSHQWVRTWNATQWIAAHRGLGTVTGQVAPAPGGTLTAVRAWLRKPNGGMFRIAARKHITPVSANGTFTMSNVRPGKYRLVAGRKKPMTHEQIAVHPGSIVHASLTL